MSKVTSDVGFVDVTPCGDLRLPSRGLLHISRASSSAAAELAQLPVSGIPGARAAGTMATMVAESGQDPACAMARELTREEMRCWPGQC